MTYFWKIRHTILLLSKKIMNHFYWLIKADCPSDWGTRKANPLYQIRDYDVPGINCPVCTIWAGSRRLYIPVRAGAESEWPKGPLSIENWKIAVKKIRSLLKIDTDVELMPGDILGKPKFELLEGTINDLMFPFPGQVIVTTDVATALQQSSLQGAELMPIEIVKAKGNNSTYASPLFELRVKGYGWRKGVDESQLNSCPLCGRTQNPKWKGGLEPLDETRWDGTDFFNVDHNPNVVAITSKAKEFLEQHQFSNYRLIPWSSSAG